jgi:hypothetical protein
MPGKHGGFELRQLRRTHEGGRGSCPAYSSVFPKGAQRQRKLRAFNDVAQRELKRPRP